MRRPVFTTVLVSLLLAGLTLGLYWPAARFDLIYFDDPLFVTDGAEFNCGVTWASLAWACRSVVVANWHPLTNLSFLVTHQFFGVNPGAEHLVNALFHAANAALVFLWLRRLTRATWRSALVAAIFAWHPLRVESVAWIAERKDVLCAFFFLLTLLAWARWAQTPSEAGSKTPEAGSKSSPQPAASYWLALVFFALALLSKPMAVTLPFVLLLLDIWPLGRLRNPTLNIRNLKPLIAEKLPFFGLMVLFCVVTYWVQHDYAAMTPWDKLSLAPRVANAIASYLNYPAQLFWPANLAAMYPFPKDYDVMATFLKAALLLAISAGCWQQRARRPWLAVGWCWFLGTAVPIIGIIQVGEQAMADRYTYLPLIGPVVALVWTAAEISPRERGGKILFATMTLLILAGLLVLSARQLQFWRNTIALFEHNVAVTPTNGSAHFTLGIGYEHAGDTNRALACYRVAKTLSPNDLQPRRSLASRLASQGEFAAAEVEYTEILALNPNDFSDHGSLASVLAAEGRVDEEMFQLNEAVRLNPNSAATLNNLAWELAVNPRMEIRDRPRAVQLAQRACELTHSEQAVFLGTLAAAQAETGEFDAAIATAQRACDRAAKHGETNLLTRNLELLERYRQHQTARE